MVKAGDAAFVTSAPLVARSGTRSKFEDTKEVQTVESFEWNEEAKQLVPKFVERSVGTIFEVDPIVSPGDDAINLNFALEHHTGEPEIEIIQVPLGEAGDSKEVSVTRFHLKKITTRIFIESGTSALIGAFEITGSPSTSSRPTIPGAKRLAFLRADLQEPGDH